MIEGSSNLVGSAVSATGDILSPGGNVVGKAKPYPEGLRKGEKPEDGDAAESVTGKSSAPAARRDAKAEASDAKDIVSPDSKCVKFADSEPETLGKGQEAQVEASDEPTKFESEPSEDKFAGVDNEFDTTASPTTETFEKSPTLSETAKEPTSALDEKKTTGAEEGPEVATITAAEDMPEAKPEPEAKLEPGPEPEADAEADTEAQPEAEPVDLTVLKNGKVNKAGNVVDENGHIIGHVTEGAVKKLFGRTVDENGEIWNDSGKVIGKAEPALPDELNEPAPFEEFPDAVVEPDGNITFDGAVIGRVIEGDVKKLRGKVVDEDGDILDRAGNVIGKAERWEEEEEELEEVIDRSILAGKRVNKLGNIVDTSGAIFGRLVEGEAKKLAGRMCDKEGNVMSESGEVIGKAEVIAESEREGLKEGPFAELVGCTVGKDGKIVTPGGEIVGLLVDGDPKALFGRPVDEDGDILDKNGNALGKAERWEEPEKAKNPLEGRKINREGNVIDADGNIIGKLTSGDLGICFGKEIDSDGDVIDSKGNTIGHALLLADIPPETETAEEKEKREQAEKDKELATKMAACLTQCLDKIRPICKMITQKIEKAERTPEDERDEEGLVREVRPLIEEGSNILREAHGIVVGLDPDGHIQANAKHKTATREATPEEFHLAEVLKEVRASTSQRRVKRSFVYYTNLYRSLRVPSLSASTALSARSKTCLTLRRNSTRSGASSRNLSSKSLLASACSSTASLS